MIEVLVWTIFSLLGLAFAGYNVRQERKNLRLVDQEGLDNGMRSVAKQGFITQGLMGLKLLLMSTIGIVTLAWPEASWRGRFSIYGLLVIALLVALNSAWTAFMNSKLLAIARIQVERDQSTNNTDS